MESFLDDIDIKDIIVYLADELSSVYGVSYRLDDTASVGWGRTYIDPYSMDGNEVIFGCLPSGGSFECDVCSAVIAVYHEFRHLAQLECLHDENYCLSGLSYGSTTLVSTSFAALQPYVKDSRHDYSVVDESVLIDRNEVSYYDKNYNSLPHEIDAERFGTIFGLRFVEGVFGKDFLNKGMKERFDKLSENEVAKEDYPGSLSIAKLVAGSELGLSEMFKLYFGINALPTAMDRYNTLLDINVKKGFTSPIIAEKCDIRSRRCNGRDVSYVGNYEVDIDDLFERNDEYD